MADVHDYSPVCSAQMSLPDETTARQVQGCDQEHRTLRRRVADIDMAVRRWAQGSRQGESSCVDQKGAAFRSQHVLIDHVGLITQTLKS